MKTPIHHVSASARYERAIRIVLLVSLFWLKPSLIRAGTHTWGGSASGYWNTGANWNTGTVPQDGDDLVFPAGPARLATTNNIPTTRRFNSITISAPNYALRGNSLVLSNGITATYGAGFTAWIEVDVSLAQKQTIECTTDNSILYVTGDIALGSSTLLVDATGNMLFGGSISGSGGIAKYGGGTLRLYGSTANTYSGTTAVNVGALELNKTGVNAMAGDLVVGNNTGDSESVRWLRCCQLPNTTDVTVNSRALLDLNNFDEAIGALTLSAGQVQTGSGLLTLGGDVTARSVVSIGNSRISGRLNLGAVTRTFTVPSVNGGVTPGLEVDADVSGSVGLTKSGDGTLGLRGSNTYSGLTTVSEGEVAVLSDNALGSTTAGTIVQPGANVHLAFIYSTSVHVGDEPLTFSGSGHLGAGGVGFTTSNSWAGPITVATNVVISIGTNEFLNLSGGISGSGGVTKNWPGTLILSGPQANTYAGDTLVNDGTLLLDKSAVDGAIPGPGELVIGDDVGGEEADVVREARGYQIDGTVNITVTESGLLDLNGFSDAVGGLNLTYGHVTTGTGTLTLGGNVVVGATDSTTPGLENHIKGRLSLGSATRTFEVQDPTRLYLEANVSGTGGLTKTGPGWLFLQGSNTYSGLTTVSDGMLHVFRSTALGSEAVGTVVEAGGALGVDHVNVNEPLTLNGTLYKWDGGGDTISWTGAITLASDAGVYVGGGTLELATVMDGPGGFTKNGRGILNLSGSNGNTYSGDTIVAEGILELGKTAGSGVAIRHGALFIGDGTGGANADVVRFAAGNQLWSTVPIVITNSGALDLNGFSDTVGPLTIAGGRATSGAGGLLYVGGTVTSLGAASGCSSLEGNVHLSGTRTFDVANSSCSPDLKVTAAISGTGGITKTGAGALGLYASNNFSGALTVNDGLVYLYNDTALGSTSGATVVNDGGVLVLANNRAIGDEPLTLNGSGDGYAGALTSIGGSNSWAGTVTLATDSVITVQTNRELNLSGVVAGPAGFIKGQPGTLILSGAAANTFSGNVEVDDGTLLLDKSVTDGALPGPGDLTIGDGTGGHDADVVRELRDYQIASSVDITVNESGLLDLNDQSDSVGGLNLFAGIVTTGSGTLTLGSNVTAQSVVGVGQSLIRGHLSLGNATRTFTITSVVGAQTPQLQITADVSGLGGLTKSGDGALALRGANTYSGLTTVADGALCVLDDSALGSTAAGTIVQTGACLWVGGFSTSTSVHVGDEPLTLSGCLAGGAASTPATSNSWAGPITLATNATVSVADEDDYLNLTGPISGRGGLTKGDYPRPNVGTLILSGADANTYAGDTVVGEGTLVLDKSAMDGAVPANLIICDATHHGTGAGFLRLERNNQIANSADVVVSGSGQFDLDGHYDRVNAVTGNGAVRLGAGHLLAGHSGSSFTFDGLVSGTGYLWKVGGGTWTLTGNNTYSGTTQIEYGTLLVNGSQPASDVTILAAGTLGGTGTVGRITSTGGLVSPGLSPGTLTTSNLLLDSASEVYIELTSGRSDQLNVGGKAALGNASLTVSAPGLLPAEGQQFLILNNDATDAVTGTFSGLPEGSLVHAGLREFRISYAGGTGNDVVLIATNTASLCPRLSIRFAGTNQVAVSWPWSDIAWRLQSATNLVSEGSAWAELPPPYPTNASGCIVTEPASANNRFYRLRNP